jgi:hypothetical protein
VREFPKEIQAAGGPIVVRVVSQDEVMPKSQHREGVRFLGSFDGFERVIRVADCLDENARWTTLFHEVMEAAVWDSGLQNLLKKKTKEAVCDVGGLAMYHLFVVGIEPTVDNQPIPDTIPQPQDLRCCPRKA